MYKLKGLYRSQFLTGSTKVVLRQQGKPVLGQSVVVSLERGRQDSSESDPNYLDLGV